MVFFLIEKEKIKEYNVNVLGGEPKNIIKRRKYKMKKMIKKIAAAFMAMALVAVGMLAANKAEVKAATTVIVAGESALCGSNWDATDDTNVMTNNAGVWSKTYSDVAVGTYNFKVVADGSWKGLDGTDANVQFAVGTVCDVTITYNETTGAIEVNGSGLVTPTLDVEKIIIAGSASLFGSNFGQTDENNRMTASNDVYTKTYTGVAAGTYEAKFTANGAWSDNWGGTFSASGTESDAEYNGGNISFTVPYTQATVTFELDLTDFDYGTKTGATFTITVVDTTPVEEETTTAANDEEETTTAADDDEDETTTAADDDEDETTTAADDEDETTTAADDDDETTAADDDDDETTAADDEEDTNTYHVAGEAGLCGEAWNPAANQMTKNDDGTWSIKFTNVKAGTYAFKVATNGAWDNGEYNLDGDASNNGPNASITVAEDGTTVIISFDGEKAIITMNEVPAGGGEDTPAGDSSMVAIFAILAVLAAAGVVTVAVAKRRAIEE